MPAATKERLRTPEASEPDLRPGSRSPPALVRAARRARRHPRRHRYAVVYDVNGPHVRLGLLWFVVSVAAVVAGPIPTALLFGGTAATAALQAARAWRRRRVNIDRRVVGVGAAVLPLAASLHTVALGVALIALAAGAYYVALVTGSQKRPTLVDAAYLMQCSLLPGLAAAGVVLTVRYSTWAALALLCWCRRTRRATT